MTPATFTCDTCGDEFPLDQLIRFSAQSFCPSCLEHETLICSECGDRIRTTDNEGDGNHPLCTICYEESFTRCIHCGALLRETSALYASDDPDEVEPMCYDCYVRETHSHGIQSYCYKPTPIFYGESSRFLGIELEIDGAGESDYYANQLLAVGNKERDHIYIKHDGSLDDGLEIVTHPMTLEYHQTEMPWEKIVREALHQGYTSHKAGTCGLHVHVNRDSLGDSEWEQEDTIARILYLVETFWHELLKFSRRTQQQMDRWASRYGRKDDPKDVLHTAKRSDDRYTAVNLTPSRTIEFRMFRGTLKYNTIIATLQMVEHLCDVAFSVSDTLIKDITWTEFVSGIPKGTMPELVQYLKERRLYVNEPVATEEEV